MIKSRSEQYVLDEDYVLRGAEELGFSPREGYSFVHWVGLGGVRYEPGQTIRISDREFSLSAVWQPSGRTVTVIRLQDAADVDIYHAASSGGKISVDVGEDG